MNINRKKFYEAVVSSDNHQLEQVLEKLRTSSNNKDLEDIVSRVCIELKLNNIQLSDQTDFLLENILLEIRFSYNVSQNHVQFNDIKNRISLISKIVANLHTNIENDELFIFSLTFVAKQIYVLKNWLKSTYDRLPWEEIEFCILSYIRSCGEHNELNIFYKAALDKSDIVRYLSLFISKLTKLQFDISNVPLNNLSKLPNMQRDEAFQLIIKSCSDFDGLYNAFEQIRDIYSLSIISEYVELISSVDPYDEMGQLIIIRALHVIGEHLKSTLAFPQLSKATSDFLILSLDENTRDVILYFYNSTSHVYSYYDIVNVERNKNKNFFCDVQTNVKNVVEIIEKVLIKNKIQLIRDIANKFLDTTDIKMMGNIASVFKNDNILGILQIVPHDQNKHNEFRKLQVLIEQLDTNIPIKTTYTTLLFHQMKDMLENVQQSAKQLKTYRLALLGVSDLCYKFQIVRASDCETLELDNLKSVIKHTVHNSIQGIELGILGKIIEMVIIIYMNITPSNQAEYLKNSRLVAEIINISKFEMDCAECSIGLKKLLIEKGFNIVLYGSTETNFSTPKRQCREQISSKLAVLKGLFQNETSNRLKYSQFKVDLKIQSLVEALLLDIISVSYLENDDIGDLVNFMDSNIPSLVGRDLLYYLVHKNVIVDVLVNVPLTIYLNADKILRDKMNYQKYNIIKRDYAEIESQYNNDSKILTQKQNMFTALKEDRFDDFKNYIDEEAFYIRSRSINMSTCLHFAAEGCGADTIKFLHNHGLKLEAKNSEFQTTLHIAAEAGNIEVVKYLLRNENPDINGVDNFHRTALNIAAQKQQKVILQTLISNNADLTITDNLGISPLYWAVYTGNKEILELFFTDKTKKQLHRIYGGQTALHLACEKGLVEIVEILLTKKLKVNARCDLGRTPAHLAAGMGHLDVLNLLVLKGADLNARCIRGLTLLHLAAEGGNNSVVKILLEHGSNVNMADRYSNYTALHIASYFGNASITQILLRHNANVNAVSREGATPLHIAIESDNVNVVKVLLNHDNINFNLRDSNELTPLLIATRKGNVEIVKLLIQKGAEVNGESNKEIPLHIAAKNGNAKLVDILVNNGALINARSSNGCLPIHAAVKSGNKEILEILINSGADVHARTSDGSNCLHIAAAGTSSIIVKQLIQRGVDINSRTKGQGRTPLHEAVIRNNRDISNSLIENGADVNCQDNVGNSAMHMVTAGGHADMVKILIENGANVNIRNKSGITPLYTAVTFNQKKILQIIISRKPTDRISSKLFSIAVVEGNIAIVELLCDYFPDVFTMAFDEGLSSLHVAAVIGQADILKLLLRKGAKIGAKSYGGLSALSVAADRGFVETVKILLANGADINDSDHCGGTPLQYACQSGSYEIVKVLLDNGAKVNVPNKENKLPIEYAVAKGHFKIMKLLISTGEIDINRKGCHDFTMLHIAAQNGQCKIIEYLVKKGADINSRDYSGSAPIHLAARYGFLDIIELFLQFGVDINEGGIENNTLLHYAAASDNIEVLKYILDCGLQVNSVNYSGQNSLYVACLNPNKKVIEILLNHGAMYNITGTSGEKPQHFTDDKTVISIFSSIDKLFKLIKLNKALEIEHLIKEGVFLNARDKFGQSPLVLAVYKGQEIIVRTLLQNKASPNLAAKNGWTALHYAVKYGKSKIVKLLLSYGAKYNAPSDNGKTPIDFSVNGDIIHLLKLVDDSFNAVKSRDTKNIRRLHKIKDRETIKAVMNARNKEGDTFMVLAMKNDITDVEHLKCILQADVRDELVMIDALHVQGKFGEMLPLLEKLYLKRKDVFGVDNPATLEMRSVMAEVLSQQQKYHESLKIFEEIYQIEVELFGINSIFSLTTRSKIAVVLHLLGRSSEALNIFESIHSIQKKILQSDHRDLLFNRIHVSMILCFQGKYKEALRINTDALQKSFNELGASHPLTLLAKFNRALCLENLDKYDEALELYHEVYEKRKMILGPNHPETLMSLHSKLSLLSTKMNVDEVFKTYQEMYDTQLRTLGLNHLSTLTTAHNIGHLCHSHGKHYSAYKMFKISRDGKRKVLGENHPTVSESEGMMKSVLDILQLKGVVKEGEEDFLEHLETALYVAASEGDYESVGDLLKSGVGVNQRNNAGRTPLHFAVSEDQVHVVELLLKNGADITAETSKGNTALHIACSRGSMEIVEMLVEYAKTRKIRNFFDVQTSAGKATALHVAAEKGYFDLVKLLLENGAVYNIRNKACKTPMSLSRDGNVIRLLKLIEEVFAIAAGENAEIIIGKVEILEPREFFSVVNTHNRDGLTLRKLLVTLGKMKLAKILTKLIDLHND